MLHVWVTNSRDIKNMVISECESRPTVFAGQPIRRSVILEGGGAKTSYFRQMMN